MPDFEAVLKPVPCSEVALDVSLVDGPSVDVFDVLPMDLVVSDAVPFSRAVVVQTGLMVVEILAVPVPDANAALAADANEICSGLRLVNVAEASDSDLEENPAAIYCAFVTKTGVKRVEEATGVTCGGCYQQLRELPQV